MKNFHIIVGVSKNNGIGFKGTIPWHVPEDLKYFKYLTTVVNNPNKQNAIIMGRNTFESNYKQHKKDAIFYCKKFLEKPQYNSWNWILDNEKKDDLADCFLQGIWFFNEKMKK